MNRIRISRCLGPSVVLVFAVGCGAGLDDFRLPSVAAVPPVVDLGEVEVLPGATREAVFEVVNQGTDELLLAGADSSCGCTVVDWPRPRIRPGKSSRVLVKVKPRQEAGPQSSIVTISSNDPVRPHLEVPIRWVARYPITVEPPSLDLGWVPSGQPVERIVTVTLTERVVGEQMTFRASDSVLSADWDSSGDSSKPGARRLKVRLTPTTGQGQRTGLIELKSGDGEFGASLPVAWRSGPAVTVSPSTFFRGDVAAGSSVSGKLLVTAADGSRLTIERVELDDRTIDRSAVTIDPADATRSVVDFEVSTGASPGVERHRVRIILGRDGHESVEVPVTLVVRGDGEPRP